MARDDDKETLCTVKGAARILDVSVMQIYRLGKAGDLDLIKLGRNTRVTRASIDSYINNAPKVYKRKN